MAVCCSWLASCCRLRAVRQIDRLFTTSSGMRSALWHVCTASTCCLKLSISDKRCYKRTVTLSIHKDIPHISSAYWVAFQASFKPYFILKSYIQVQQYDIGCDIAWLNICLKLHPVEQKCHSDLPLINVNVSPICHIFGQNFRSLHPKKMKIYQRD